MLLRFSVANFRSFWREQQLSMIASSLKDDPTGLTEAPALRGEKLLPLAVIYGANASGKSNLLKALGFMLRTIWGSHKPGGPDTKIERNRFALDPNGDTEPSRFCIEFLSEGVRYEYGFEAFEDRFKSEWLHWWPSGVRSILFKRDRQEFNFGRSLNGRNLSLAKLTRPNSLFFSAAIQNNHPQLTKIDAFFSAFSSSSNVLPLFHRLHDFTDVGLGPRMVSFLESIATGISSFQIDKRPSESEIALMQTAKNFSMSDEWFDRGEAFLPRLRFGHRGSHGDISFIDLKDESDGTQWLADKLGPILRVLDRGGVIAIDEFGANIHTLAAEAILGLFASKETNPKGAQLIVATHDTNLLGSSHIRRDQVWFTEKNAGGATMLTPLTDIRTRKGDEIEKGYLQGRYGAVPFAHFDPSILKAD